MGIDHPWGARIRSLFYEDFFVGLGPCDLPARIRRSIRAAVFFCPVHSNKCDESTSICIDLFRMSGDQGLLRRAERLLCALEHLQVGTKTLGCGS